MILRIWDVAIYFRFESYRHFRSFQLPATAKSARDDVADARRQANRLAFSILWSRIASTGLAIQGRVRSVVVKSEFSQPRPLNFILY